MTMGKIRLTPIRSFTDASWLNESVTNTMPPTQTPPPIEPLPPPTDTPPNDHPGQKKPRGGLVVFVQWTTEVGACPTCLEYEALGPVPAGYLFGGDTNTPPAHDNCRCSIQVVPMPVGMDKSNNGDDTWLR